MLGDVFEPRRFVSFQYWKPASARSAFSAKAAGGRRSRKQLPPVLRRIKQCGLKIGSGKIIIAKVRREDWAESWKRHFKPIEIGNSLLVKPSWSKRRPRKNQAVVILDPGLSFGTGQHPTTSFCLIKLSQSWRAARKIEHAEPPRSNHFWISAPVREFWRLRRRSSATSRFTHLTLIPKPSAIARANARVNRVAGKIDNWRGDVTKLPAAPGAKIRFDLRQPDFQPAHCRATADCGAVEVAAERWCWREF